MDYKTLYNRLNTMELYTRDICYKMPKPVAGRLIHSSNVARTALKMYTNKELRISSVNILVKDVLDYTSNKKENLHDLFTHDYIKQDDYEVDIMFHNHPEDFWNVIGLTVSYLSTAFEKELCKK